MRLGLVLLAAGVVFGQPARAAVVEGRLSATVEWTAASGPVAGYRVFVALNDDVSKLFGVVTEPRATIAGIQQYGDRISVAVAAIDDAGTQGPLSQASEPIEFATADGPNLPPVVTPVGNRTLDIGETQRIAITATDPNGDPLQLTVAGLPSFASFVDSGNGVAEIVVEPTLQDAGHYLVTISARDDGDPPALQFEAFDLVVNGPNRAPEFRPSAPFELMEGGAGFLFLRASDPDGDVIAIDDVDLPPFATLYDQGGGTALLRIEPSFDDAGSYAWTVRARDDGEPALGTDLVLNVVVEDVNRPPEWTSEASFSAAAGEVVDAVVTASDGDGDGLALELAGGPGFASASDHGDGSATLTLMPDIEAQGDYVVQLRATDDGEPNHSVVQTAEVSVIGAPALHVEPRTLLFDVSYSETAPTAVLLLSNIGGGVLNYSVSPSTPRFSVASSGQLSGAEVEVVEVTFDVSHVPVGAFSASIEISHDGLGAPVHVVDVWLNMRDPKAKSPSRRVVAPSLRDDAVRADIADPKPADALFAAQSESPQRLVTVRQWDALRSTEVSEVIRPGGVQTTLSSGGLLEPGAWGGPTAVAEGPDGTLYVTVVDGLLGEAPAEGELPAHTEVTARVVEIDPETGGQAVVSADGLLISPQGIAVGGDGRIFVADLSSGVVRIDPETGDQLRLAALPGANGLRWLEDGGLLVTLNYGEAASPRIVRIDPETGEIRAAGVTLDADDPLPGEFDPPQ